MRESSILFKIGIGLELEPEVNTFIRELANQGKRIFLDYKYLDIEATVERAVSQAARIGVTFVTVHHANPRSISDAAIRGRGESDLKTANCDSAHEFRRRRH